jgi:succinate dehydrogenase hydrophobic anchor subunit
MITKTKGAELWIALLQRERWVCITIILFYKISTHMQMCVKSMTYSYILEYKHVQMYAIFNPLSIMFVIVCLFCSGLTVYCWQKSLLDWNVTCVRSYQNDY